LHPWTLEEVCNETGNFGGGQRRGVLGESDEDSDDENWRVLVRLHKIRVETLSISCFYVCSKWLVFQSNKIGTKANMPISTLKNWTIQ
jgi:hypothetical protein